MRWCDGKGRQLLGGEEMQQWMSSAVGDVCRAERVGGGEQGDNGQGIATEKEAGKAGCSSAQGQGGTRVTQVGDTRTAQPVTQRRPVNGYVSTVWPHGRANRPLGRPHAEGAHYEATSARSVPKLKSCSPPRRVHAPAALNGRLAAKNGARASDMQGTAGVPR